MCKTFQSFILNCYIYFKTYNIYYSSGNTIFYHIPSQLVIRVKSLCFKAFAVAKNTNMYNKAFLTHNNISFLSCGYQRCKSNKILL